MNKENNWVKFIERGPKQSGVYLLACKLTNDAILPVLCKVTVRDILGEKLYSYKPYTEPAIPDCKIVNAFAWYNNDDILNIPQER
jgi:hypothetical protein